VSALMRTERVVVIRGASCDEYSTPPEIDTTSTPACVLDEKATATSAANHQTTKCARNNLIRSIIVARWGLTRQLAE
jgi:hypothetical protein